MAKKIAKGVKHPVADTPLQLQEGLDALETETRKKILIQLTDKAKVKLVKRKLLKP